MEWFSSFKNTPFPSSPALVAGRGGEDALTQYSGPTGQAAYANLLKMLQSQGRVDPRLLASLQAQNARSTQQRQDTARAASARGGLGNSGLAQALQAAIGQAGANTSANLSYQDLADSYKRNQENLGLYNQLVTQPSLGYSNLGVEWGLGQQQQRNAQKAGWLGFFGNLAGTAGKAFGMG